MSRLLNEIQALVRQDNVSVSRHGYRNMLERLIDVEDTVQGVLKGSLIEEYSESRGEPRVLVLQAETDGELIHAVWEIIDDPGPTAFLVTAYRPDPREWSADRRRRLP